METVSRWDDNARQKFIDYAVKTYTPLFEDAIVEQAIRIHSSNEAIKALGQLEQAVVALSQGQPLGNGDLAFIVDMHGKTAPLPFTYRAEEYKDYFDVAKDLQTQCKLINRTLSDVLKMSFRGISELVNRDPPYNMTSYRIHSLERQKPRYVARLSQYAQLTPNEAEHLKALPIVHPDHMNWVEKIPKNPSE